MCKCGDYGRCQMFFRKIITVSTVLLGKIFPKLLLRILCMDRILYYTELARKLITSVPAGNSTSNRMVSSAINDKFGEW